MFLGSKESNLKSVGSNSTSWPAEGQIRPSNSVEFEFWDQIRLLIRISNLTLLIEFRIILCRSRNSSELSFHHAIFAFTVLLLSEILFLSNFCTLLYQKTKSFLLWKVKNKNILFLKQKRLKYFILINSIVLKHNFWKLALTVLYFNNFKCL